jgi:ABC-type oligopeptide transport system substrate-binding subunit
MSFDAQITELNTNIKALIAALGAASTGTASAASTGTADTGTAKTTGKGKTKTAEKTGPTREEMVAALTEVKEKFGAAEAKAIITKVGAATMADIADDKIQSAFTLAKAKLEAASADDTQEEDDGL